MSSYPTAGNLDHWWLTTPTWNRLHAVPRSFVDPDDEDACEELRDNELTMTTICKVTAPARWPGVFSRLGRPRCAHCCRVLGIPPGYGTPGNESSRLAREQSS